jgi:anti-sigma regulatory factor (Ser/Thr protein kinase)
VSTLTAAVDLRPVPASVPVARHLVLDLLGAWRAPHDAGDAALLVTELVANVVDHVAGEASFTVELSMSEDWLRISVADGSALQPVVREFEAATPRGRGMRLVEGIADRWGVEDGTDGKRVWFELAPRGGPGGGRRGPGFADGGSRGRSRGPIHPGGDGMSEPDGKTYSAGEGLSDEEMVQTVAEQTDSISEHADVAGKDWDGDASKAPDPNADPAG